ncbi:protein kinase domain-containing protein [Streptomyces millisiae]|uniref:non-specific serine/threonine protein kinase n=1 Tax=Streptomyces millisiae TaxID=3075542 RepID=A0ABU2LTD6_9ACTN|nr:protein kinase [Streptomyces sp. DSM 44918]MDT0320854.1 protein kinase [Streptomyces sp. DSM 44918]
MAQDHGAADSGDGNPEAAGNEVPDTPEMWGNNGLVGDGRYRLTHRLGRGGMAEVFAAEDLRLGRTVAIKLLRADLAEDPVSKARFTREAQSVAGLNHHAVVAVYDSGEEVVGGSVMPYMVMELVQGRTIRELLIDAEAPPVNQALLIVSGVLEALAYSHQHGIVHRDIKPANVIITDTGAVKVMDFGIARALHGAAQTMTQTGMVMGTPQYLSPEQALGKTVDTRSDLYAVGCLLYELLALRPPFVGETPLSVVYQHVQDTPRPPSEVSTSTPPELDGLVMRALTKNPDDRFQSAEEMRGMIQYALRMLEEHGGHTGGLWNTGSITGGATPPMGTPASRAGVDAPTGQLTAPMLLGNPDGGRSEPPRQGGGRRGRLLLVALAAVVAIGTGVLVAANMGGGEQENPNSDPTPTETVEEPSEEPDESPSASEEEVEEEDDTGDSYYPSDSTGGWTDDTGTVDPTTPTEEPTTPTEEPTEEPTEDPTTPPDESDGGAAEGGDGGGETDEGADEGTTTDPGTSEGAVEGAIGGETGSAGSETTGSTT